MADEGACYIVKETRTVAVWVEDGTYETFRKYVADNYEEIESALDDVADADWGYGYHSFLRKEDCDFIA